MRRVVLFPVIASVLALTGCQTGDIKAVVPITGGKTVEVLLGPNGPQPGEADGYRVSQATFMPDKSKPEVTYAFALTTAQTPDLKRIQVEDISDDPAPYPLVDDQHPEFKDGQWQGKSETITGDDLRLRWLFQVPNSYRVYRFTLTHANGKQTVFNHVAMFPQFIKAVIRSGWGEKS